MRETTIKIVLLLLAGCLLTCQDDPDELHQVNTQRLSKEAARAQEWYESILRKEVLTMERGDAGSPIEVKPDWEQVEVTSDKKQRIVETGLSMKGAFFITMDENKQRFSETGDERYAYSLSRMVIRTKLKSGKTDGFLMTVVPSVGYIELTDFNPFEKIRYIDRDKRFTGRIIYHDLNGKFVHGWVYKEGKISHSIKPVQEGADPVVMMKSSGASDCVIVEEWGWTRTCTDHYYTVNGGPPVFSHTTCTDWVWGLINSYSECAPGSGGDDEYGEDIDGENDGGSGGSGGGYNPTPGPDDTNEIIKDPSFINTKAECIYEKLHSLSGSFKRAIQKFDGEFPVSHLKFSVSYDLPNNVNGRTYPPENYVTKIALNGNNFNRPNLSIARTIVHETIHGEMFRKMLSAAQKGNLRYKEWTQAEIVQYVKNLQNDFPGIYDFYYNNYKEEWDHEQMAGYYRGYIVNLLKQFDPSQSEELYEALAWEGLKKTVAWNNLSQSEKNRINNLTTNYNNNGAEACP